MYTKIVHCRCTVYTVVKEIANNHLVNKRFCSFDSFILMFQAFSLHEITISIRRRVLFPNPKMWCGIALSIITPGIHLVISIVV